MFKKILLLTAAIVTSSFATWDYFGLLQNNSGSVKTGLYYDWDGDWSQMGLKVGARVNIVPQFELSFQSFARASQATQASCRRHAGSSRRRVRGT